MTSVPPPRMPESLREALCEIDGALATVDAMSEDYQRRSFYFIEQAGNMSTESQRVDNFVRVVRFFLEDARTLAE